MEIIVREILVLLNIDLTSFSDSNTLLIQTNKSLILKT